jgi:DNA-directed RNA polymerase specialized sigma24 family protein
MDFLADRKRRAAVSIGDEEGGCISESSLGGSGDDDGHRALVRDEASQALAVALAAQPQIYREIIELVVFQDMSYEQASEVLGGVSIGTLRSRMFHGLRRMRSTLSEVGGHIGDGLI